MNKRNLLFVMAFIGGPLFGQVVQYGKTMEMNSGGKALQGVAITIPSVHDCQPTMSDSRGQFRLSFGEHHIGDVVHGIRAKKYGYEVVNIHVLRDWTLTDQDSLRIIMAPEGKLKEARERYYDLVEQSCVSRYDSTMAFLREQLAQQKVSPTEYEYWTGETESELQRAYGMMDALADRFARINRDDMDTITALIHENLEQNDIEKAVALASGGTMETVMEAYHGFKVAFPMQNLEETVSALEMYLPALPDSLPDNLKMMSVYTQMLEGEYAVSGLKYAKTCAYIGILYKDMQQPQRAETYFKKAKAMFLALNEMGDADYTKQIERIDAWMKEL